MDAINVKVIKYYDNVLAVVVQIIIFLKIIYWKYKTHVLEI